MKFILILILALGSSNMSLNAQSQKSIAGAWQLIEGDKTQLLLVNNGLYFHTVYRGNQFLMTQGGSIDETDGNSLIASVLFNSADSSKVGSKSKILFSSTDNQLLLSLDGAKIAFNKIEDVNAPLSGVWRITSRMQEDGKIVPIHQTGSRQTLKLLTGTKFQWVAIDPAKKQFSGTGGGTYTFENGKYTEKIVFFSRDDSRVGASLIFNGKLEDGKWHHSGLSSKGAKIYEIWSKTP